MWRFRLRPLVLHSFSCGCPLQLYLVTAKSAVAAPAGDLLSIGIPRGSDACHATEGAYTTSDFIRRPQWRTGILLIGRRGGRRPGHNLTQLTGSWALRAAFHIGSKLYKVSVCCEQYPHLGPSLSNGLQSSQGYAEVMCCSGGQPETISQDGENLSVVDS